VQIEIVQGVAVHTFTAFAKLGLLPGTNPATRKE
jgi:hypothetical protein